MSNPWINEFHYDNAGTDTGEFIEIAGAAGMDLSGWSLVLYNGNGGTAYATINLAGIIADQGGGFGTLSFDALGMQNGSPDGIALVHGGLVMEFISYEGAFLATDGPANGMFSTDVGFGEDGLGTGTSVGLVGSGSDYGDFSWALITDDTPGTVNSGQTFVAPPTPDYVGLQFPSSITAAAGTTTEVIYGRIFEAGLTEAPGAPANVVAQLGYGPAGTDPTTSGDWVWIDATYNQNVGNDDEYMATFVVPDTGDWAYTYRFAINDGVHPLQFTYADLDGAGTDPGLSFDPGNLGVLTSTRPQLVGTTDSDVVVGGALSEFLDGLAGDDTLLGNGGNDQLFGREGNDNLIGGVGADALDGGTGADALIGGAGNDAYTVDNLEDVVVERFGEGTDTVSAAVTYTLTANVENLTLTGTTAINGTGNALANTITGNSAANVITGGGGFDVLSGGAGNDHLNGGDGNDILDGGAGDDVLAGNAGLDTASYASATTGVTVNLGLTTAQVTAAGKDTLSGIENLTGSSHNDRLTGNALANAIVGGAGNDTLDGSAGADTLTGGIGTDRIDGGIGNDTLSGGTGPDSFVFSTTPNASTNADKITDFSVADDTILLSSTIFAAAGPSGTLSASAFHAGTAAADADDRIIYSQATGQIYYDADGTGAGAKVLFAKVTAGTVLTSLDFAIYLPPAAAVATQAGTASDGWSPDRLGHFGGMLAALEALEHRPLPGPIFFDEHAAHHFIDSPSVWQLHGYSDQDTLW
jgi:Ca2+-binding RTX toxin-like protein